MIITYRYIGDTRSGKKIFLYETKDEIYILQQIGNLDAHDRFDALCIFQYLVIRALRKHRAEDADQLLLMVNFYRKLLTVEFIRSEMDLLLLPTAIHLVRYGKGLVKHFLHD